MQKENAIAANAMRAPRLASVAARARLRVRAVSKLILLGIAAQRRLDRGAIELRREEGDEFVHEAARVDTTAQREPRRARPEQMRRIDLLELLVARRVVRHLCDDAYAETQLDVGLDHVRVQCG